jgi:isopentenyl-diphosphate delta-isomerase
MSKQTNRKNQHVSLSENFYKDGDSSLKDVHFVHHSFPGIDVADVDLSTDLSELEFSLPFFINAMTGGSEFTGKLNQKLAIVARETGLAIATGSISAGLKIPEVQDSYTVMRKENPDGLIFANLGAGHGAENAKKAIDLMDADGLQIHVNAPQELVMPEGDREFSNWIENIQAILEAIEVPLIVKEVGFGMSRETVKLLQDIGVKYIDISGKGGTNFAQIENFRRREMKLDGMESWGQSTAVSVLEAMEVQKDSHIIASGGIRTAQDILKSLALGSDLVGISSQFMHMILQDVDEAIEQVEQWKLELERSMTLLGAKKVADLHKTDLIITGETAEWAELRDIDLKKYAKRSTEI